jgi:hypothetical protein
MNDYKDFLQELHLFSNTVCNIPIDQTRIERILFLDSEDFLQGEYSDENSFLMQAALESANEKLIKIILNNLSKAIITNCRNNVDLDSLEVPENFGYSLKINHDEKAISKKYKNHQIRPSDEKLFKKIWLKVYLQELKKIDFTIRSVIGLPQNENINLSPYTSKSNETLSQQLMHGNKKKIAKAIHTKYKGIEGFKGVHLRILLEALRELGLFSTGRTDAIFYRCCFNDFGNIGSYQAMEEKVFKKGYLNSKGLYIKHEHEVLFDNTIKFLESIINTK